MDCSTPKALEDGSKLAPVTVLIVNWNSGDLLAECLSHLMIQTIQPARSNGTYELHRIGDAVASQNIRAAILDAARLANAL